MTPLQFEAQHAAAWRELEAALASMAKKRGSAAVDRARLAALYRAACEHLAIAESRSYPVWLIERLETLTARGHQLIYAQADFGIDKLRRLFLVDFPSAVRAHRLQVLIALAVFAGPLLVIGVLSWLDPGLILSLQDASVVDQYEKMYGDADGPIGRRSAASDWQMFGFYIRNNIGIAFQCFAGGLFFGIGSLYALAFNGALAGSTAGYLTWRGFGENFYPFAITHGAFELSAIVLAGAAGLILGHALLVPGRHSRLAALELAARRAIVIVYGMTAMFFVAAVLEAFWSSASWVPAPVKVGVGAACWLAVLAYFVFQGRPRRGGRGTP
ncbi:MAG: stage II sporulation protein M [Pseudomonadota bacterium]|nr:stage II sporulation protein M [Pseudomonadota bacterium]